MVAALALLVGVAAPSIAASPGTAAADGGRGHHHRTADATFSKWAVQGPTGPSSLAGVLMIGVIGGDTGDGHFAGEVLSDDTTSNPGFWLAHVRYEFYGSEHSFILDVRVTEDDTKSPITATLRGVVTKGWLKGARMTGEYTQRNSCPIPTPGNVFGAICWQGTVHLEPRHGDD
jgi:hypothetical protein